MPVIFLSVLRFLIALVQMAGLIAYFHQYLGWGLLPTAVVALLLTLLVPIAATILGFLGAIHAWAWPWWLAFLVFLPGLAMALAAVAGVGVVGMLTAFLMKRLGLRHRRDDTPADRGSTIEGEVISSRVEPDGK